ncbi:bglI, partial [Symbiodinium pilosum]
FTKLALRPGEVEVAVVKFRAQEATKQWSETQRSWVVEPRCDVLVASSGQEQWRTALYIASPEIA